jgi:hypothetical protein
MRKTLISFLCLTSISSFSGEVRNFGNKVQVQKFHSSELKSFKLTHNNYKAIFAPNDYSYGTKMIAEYTTGSVSSLEDFAVVQYIKGCIFESALKNGDVEKWSQKVTHSFGELIPFKYSS